MFNPFICSGLFLEPLVHPKPGGVTRVYMHADKSVYNFVVNNLVFCSMIPKYASKIIDGDCILGKVYRFTVQLLGRYGLRTNTSMGSWVLHIPLIVSLADMGDDVPVEELVKRGVNLVENSSSCDTEGYFEFLKFYSPSHLGRLEVGSVDAMLAGDNVLPSYIDVVRFAGRSDIVHRELYTGYPVSLEAYSMIENYMSRGVSFEEAVSRSVVELLARYPDSLIARKHGSRVAFKVRRFAELVVKGLASLEELDYYMRNNGFNPGSILDIVSIGISLFLLEKSVEGDLDSVILA